MFVKTGQNSIPQPVTNIENLKRLVQPPEPRSMRRESSLTFHDAIDSEDDHSFTGFSAAEVEMAEEKNNELRRKLEEILKQYR